MLQFNLLPDIKVAYLKAERTRRLVLSVSVIVSVVALVLLLALVSTNFLQKKHLNDLNADIARDSKSLQNQPNLDKILTVQNQLQSLTDLHNAKPAASRLFDYLTQITPAQADINSMSIDFGQHTVSVTGTADALSTVNKYVDTIKFTTYTTDDDKSNKAQPFSDVVLSSFSLTNGKVSYTITFAYDETIFDITANPKLTVPKLITTRSELEKPNALFNNAPVDTTNSKPTDTSGNQ